jgi:uncharacterized protein
VVPPAIDQDAEQPRAQLVDIAQVIGLPPCLGQGVARRVVGQGPVVAPREREPEVGLQVSAADPAKRSLALNNARAVPQGLGGDKVAIEIVAYGAGIGMLKLDSVAGARISEAMADGMSVVACKITMRNPKIGRDDMLPKIGDAGAGVVPRIARQKEGDA